MSIFVSEYEKMIVHINEKYPEMRFRWCCLLLGILLISGCSSNEETYFNGIRLEASPFPLTVNLKADSLDFGELNDGKLTVCDSFLLFKSSKYPDFHCYAFDKENGKFRIKLCPKGEGPDEFRLCLTSEQTTENADGDKMLWVTDPYESSRWINITQSVVKGKTICDSIIPLSWMKHFQYPPASLFFLKSGAMLGRNQCEQDFVYDSNYNPGKYHLYYASSDSLMKEYVIYKNPILSTDRDKGIRRFVNYYVSYDNIKPDETKVVMAMQSVGQINILDLETGALTGIYQKESISFENLENCNLPLKFYYTGVAVDNQFVFVPYSGETYLGGYPKLADKIHVFDWSGKTICEIKIDKPVFGISYDANNHVLYGNDHENNVYCYDVSFLYQRNVD